MLSDLPPYASKKSKKNSISLDCKSYKSGMLEEEEEGRGRKYQEEEEVEWKISLLQLVQTENLLLPRPHFIYEKKTERERQRLTYRRRRT